MLVGNKLIIEEVTCRDQVSANKFFLPKSNENPLSLFVKSIGNSTTVSLESAIIAKFTKKFHENVLISEKLTVAENVSHFYRSELFV